MVACHSGHRCAQITCPVCTWRHALQISRRIATSTTGPYYAITLAAPNFYLSQVPQIRIQLRNAIDYLRRRDRRWRNLTFHLWLTNSGNLKGIAALGPLGPQEVAEKLGPRWPMTLRPIAAVDMRVEVYRALRRVWSGETEGRRYQPVSLFIGPRRSSAQAWKEPVDWTWTGSVEPMPVLV